MHSEASKPNVTCTSAYAGCLLRSEGTHLAFSRNSSSDCVSQKTLCHTLSGHVDFLHSKLGKTATSGCGWIESPRSKSLDTRDQDDYRIAQDSGFDFASQIPCLCD